MEVLRPIRPCASTATIVTPTRHRKTRSSVSP
jgi:hypothetical protein